jgi:hypothetical protein
MAFNQFKSHGEVLAKFEVSYSKQPLVRMLPNAAPSLTFQEQITFALENDMYATSEYARCESLIFPTLQEAWKPYRAVLRLWSHVPIAADEPLTGTPDYLIAQASHLGTIVLGKPILAVVEAKRENFEEGWAQCTAEMLAVQKLNDNAHAVWGIVTNGELWQFGSLVERHLTQEPTFYSIARLDELFGALSYVMNECAKQAAKPVAKLDWKLAADH